MIRLLIFVLIISFLGFIYFIVDKVNKSSERKEKMRIKELELEILKEKNKQQENNLKN